MTKVQVKEKTKMNMAMKFFREVVAIVFWMYLLVKLMLFDIDVYLLEITLPEYIWVIKYKFLIFLALTSVIWLSMGNKNFYILFLYISFYPFVVMFWKIPKFIIYNWSAAIIITPFIFNIFSSLKWFFVRITLLLIAFTCALFSDLELVLYGSIVTILSLLIFYLLSSFQEAYKTTAFSKIAEALSDLRENMSDISFIKEKVIGSLSKTTNEDSKYHTELSIVYTFNFGVEFMTDKIRDVLKSRKMDLFLVLSWLWSVSLTVISFSFTYFALYKIDHGAFNPSQGLNYFSFLGYSIGKMMPSSVSTISPSNTLAIFLSYGEIASSLLIVIILVFTILTATRERYREDIERITAELGNITTLLHKGSEQLFNLAISDVERILLDDNQEFINWTRKVRGKPALLPKESVLPASSGTDS